MMTPPTWEEIRADFGLDACPLHFAAMMVSSHHRVVRDAIARHRQQFDQQPWMKLKGSLHAAEDAVCFAASAYFGVPPEDVGLVDGTTQGVGLLLAGIKIADDQEILTSTHEFHGALHSMHARTRAGTPAMRTIAIYDDPANVSEPGILRALTNEIRPNTRVLFLTWVYSNSGVKLPIAAISRIVRDVNSAPDRQDPARRLLFCVDGVVGLGVEDTTFDALGCDFFVAGCHKFLYGPRGTGIWCGTPFAWDQCDAVAPTSSRDEFPGRAHSPGGIHSYEHRWALKDAFDYLRLVGKARIARRTAELATRFKRGLDDIGPRRITIVTPRSPDFSSALVCFDVANHPVGRFVTELETMGILATVAPEDVIDGKEVNHARVGLSIFHSDDDVVRCLNVIDDLSR